IGRRHLARFIDRTVFHDARDPPPFMTVGDLAARGASRSIRFDAFHTHAVTLDPANLGEALIASASIPLVLEGVADIPRPPGGCLPGGRGGGSGGWGSPRLSPPPAVPPLEGARALSALHRPHRAGLARQGAAVAPRARRVARQRDPRLTFARVPREAALRQAS